jgi:hypothetical protein
MPDYSNGKIYTIRFQNSNEIYIGSTIQSIAVRFGGHKIPNRCCLYQLIKDKYNGDWNECYYELFENYSCSNREELHQKEGEIIRQFKNDKNYNCINKKIAGRTDKNYYMDNVDKIKEQMKEYREKNSDKVKEQKKQYRIDNADKINERKRQYRVDNADKIKEKQKEKITCDCGFDVSRTHLSRHCKSKQHQDYLASLSLSATVVGTCNERNP